MSNQCVVMAGSHGCLGSLRGPKEARGAPSDPAAIRSLMFLIYLNSINSLPFVSVVQVVGIVSCHCFCFCGEVSMCWFLTAGKVKQELMHLTDHKS